MQSRVDASGGPPTHHSDINPPPPPPTAGRTASIALARPVKAEVGGGASKPILLAKVLSGVAGIAGGGRARGELRESLLDGEGERSAAAGVSSSAENRYQAPVVPTPQVATPSSEMDRSVTQPLSLSRLLPLGHGQPDQRSLLAASRGDEEDGGEDGGVRAVGTAFLGGAGTYGKLEG